ncbi:MAG: hypothetical protein ACXWVB_10225, partial [Rhodoplanes sp.]
AGARRRDTKDDRDGPSVRTFVIVRAKSKSPERMLADLQAAGGVGGGAASEEHNRLAELPEVREKISAMMAAHWEHWVDQLIPILGNRTPMEAVKDLDGREIVESLVMQAERPPQSQFSNGRGCVSAVA